jgi:ERCC4-related helicase
MALLTEREWRTSYRHEDGDLIELFYNPALACAAQYDRMTGYFSADALALASRGIDELIGNDGRMRLIVGCTLEHDEQRAIGDGYDLRTAVEQKLAAVPMEPPDEKARSGLARLAWMVAQGHLDVKVAVPVDPGGKPVHAPGLYHEKVGVITDAGGKRLSFSGSINETAGGWVNNRESFHVHCSWYGGREEAHLDDEVDAFARLWEGRTKSVRVFEFPDAAKQKLLEFLPQDDRFITPPHGRLRPVEPQPEKFHLLPGEYLQLIWSFLTRCPALANGVRAGECTSAITPWPHQIRTYTGFLMRWPWRLLIADEVGLGKTISAGLIIRQALLAGLARRILILAPKSVLIQWQGELYEKFNLNVPIYDGEFLSWKSVPGMRAPTEKPVARDAWQSERIVLCSSHLMRRADRQGELLNGYEWDLVVLDEAHHARRRGAGTAQEKGPNALLEVMRELRSRCKSLLLLTATPMQVHPVELWDLMDLLGLPPEWQARDDSFTNYFALAAGNPSADEMEYLARLFRSTETEFGALTGGDLAGILPSLSNLLRNKVVGALRDASTIRRRTMSADQRRAAMKILQAASPLRHRMVRNTRGLLRRYAKEGRLSLPIATRDPRDVAVDMTAAEASLYREVEDYISDMFDEASPGKRSAVGFVMTVYRRRLASSFKALEKTMVARLQRVAGIEDADASQDETEEESIDADVVRLAQDAFACEEKTRILQILRNIAKLGTDSKARRLKSELDQAIADGFDSAIIFTQYTDTMEYLRDFLADQLPELPVASYSGAGGAWRGGAGNWLSCSKEEIKRRLKMKQVRLLVCSDAAGEGLNLQFSGVLANYDLPWNPMKIEQRIGRIDRLGQTRPVIRILNFAYRDTVEEDVFFSVGTRINLFQGIVGRLQPILSRLPRRLEELALTGREGRERERQRFIAQLGQEVSEAQRAGFDLDEASSESLEIPALPESPLTLSGLDRILQTSMALPPQSEVRSLDPRSYSISLPGGEPLRVTTDAGTFDLSADNQQLFSPGGEAFELMAQMSSGSDASPEAEACAWQVKRPDGSSFFAVNTESGVEQIRSLNELLVALNRMGKPIRFPLADWPGVVTEPIS